LVGLGGVVAVLGRLRNAAQHDRRRDEDRHHFEHRRILSCATEGFHPPNGEGRCYAGGVDSVKTSLEGGATAMPAARAKPGRPAPRPGTPPAPARRLPVERPRATRPGPAAWPGP